MARNKISFALLFVVLVLTGIYASLNSVNRAYINSIVEIPVCSAQIGQKLNIPWKYSAIRDYAISSLRSGMTRDEVEKALEVIAPIQVSPSTVGDQILIRICPNPLGNIVLQAYYSPSGVLEKVVDTVSD